MKCKQVKAYKSDDGGLHATLEGCTRSNISVALEKVFDNGVVCQPHPGFLIAYRVMQHLDEVREILLDNR